MFVKYITKEGIFVSGSELIIILTFNKISQASKLFNECTILIVVSFGKVKFDNDSSKSNKMNKINKI